MENKVSFFKEVSIYVTANGYTILFKERRGEYTSKNFFVAKTLDEVKKLMEENLLEPKNY